MARSVVRLALPTIGSGTEDDPIRVNLPTYRLIETSPDGRWAVVDTPSDCIACGLVETAPLRTVDKVSAPDLSRVRGADARRLADFFDRRYQEHAGVFRPI